MKLTIEIGSVQEVEQLLNVFKTMNLENIQVVLDKKTDFDLLQRINRPFSKTLDLERLKKAKNYKGVNKERFDRLVKELNITEPIDVLLSQLSQ